MIEVDDDYYIDVNQYNYIPTFDRHATRIDKDGNEIKITDVIGYYSTLPGALEGIYKDKIRKKVSGENVVKLSDVIKLIKSEKNELENMLKSLEVSVV